MMINKGEKAKQGAKALLLTKRVKHTCLRICLCFQNKHNGMIKQNPKRMVKPKEQGQRDRSQTKYKQL